MPIAELKKLVVPPDSPYEVGTLDDWRAIEKQLGVQLPDDYREFVFAYGSGLFAGFYRVYNPFAVSEYLSLTSSVHRVCDYNRESQKTFPERFPFPYFPEQGGLLPWGNDDNGNDYLWLTQGPPTEWRVVQDENRGTGIKVHSLSFAGFLLSVLKKQTKALVGDYPSDEDYQFESWRPDSGSQ